MAYDLASLVQIIEQDQYHLILDVKPQIQSLLEKARFLRDLLAENSSKMSTSETVNLEIRIRDIAHEAENLIECYIRNRIFPDLHYRSSELDLTYVTGEFDSITENMSQLVTAGDTPDHPSPREHDPSQTEHHASLKNVVEGLDSLQYEYKILMDQLLAKSSELQIIPIVGMGGIGKTTLAQMVYNDSTVASHFDCRAWVTISQEPNVQMTLLAVMEGFGILITNEMRRQNIGMLGFHVYKTLKNRRYFIVLDDIWSIQAWDTLRRFLPDDGTCSRILLTTRTKDLAAYAGSSKPLYKALVDEGESWRLFGEIMHLQVNLPIENLIEYYIRERVFPDLHHQSSELDLTYVTGEFDFITDNMSQLVTVGDTPDHPSPIEHDPPSTEHHASLRNVVVGLDNESEILLDQILAKSSKLQIIPIVGQGGIGKTTLAQKVYNDPTVASNFNYRAWVTISKEHNVQMTLLAVLEGLGKLITNEMRRQKVDKLGAYVRNTLKGRKYFIVLDDIWDIQDWDTLGRFLPDDGTGSRILLTTRTYVLADYAASSEPLHKALMDERESWLLFCEKLHLQVNLPIEFEEIGKKITILCSGLPLAITLMAGLLSTSTRTVSFWKLVAKYVQSTVLGDHEIGFLVILQLIYNLLPYYLKPCFLYIGAFPEDLEIRASRITKMWISEGFLNPDVHNSMEDTAEAYLKTLIHMNLLLICRIEPNGRIKSFKIHDIVRDFCLSKGLEANFLWYKDLYGHNIPKNQKIVRRLSARTFSQDTRELELTLVRSFLCIGRAPLHQAPKFSRSIYLRILDIFELEFFQFPAEILQLVLLRYLSFSCHSNLTSSISKLQNLQTLIIRRLPSFRACCLPSELWDLSKLRHVKSKETCIWYYPRNGKSVVQKELQTLSNVQMVGVTNEFLCNIPNIRKLGIFCNISMKTIIDLACLHQLETLKCSSDWSLATCDFLSYLTFPPSLKKVNLSLCKIPWGFMATLGALPNLKQLKLQKSDFLGIHSSAIEPEWEPAHGEFAKLISLHMEDLNLVHWKAHNIHFPRLRNLIIRRCPITKISSDFGNIPTIELIEVDTFSPSLVASAMGIQKEQNDLGNILLQVHIKGT